MAPLIILLITFLAAYIVSRYAPGGRLNLSLTGRIAMAAMLVVTGITHFMVTEAMVVMMPEQLPYKRELVYFTGICEFAGAIGIVWQRTSRLASYLLVIFFVMVLPANISGSLKQASLGGMEYGPVYLLFRVPLQAFFIWWAWYFGIKRNPAAIDASPE